MGLLVGLAGLAGLLLRELPLAALGEQDVAHDDRVVAHLLHQRRRTRTVHVPRESRLRRRHELDQCKSRAHFRHFSG